MSISVATANERVNGGYRAPCWPPGDELSILSSGAVGVRTYHTQGWCAGRHYGVTERIVKFEAVKAKRWCSTCSPGLRAYSTAMHQRHGGPARYVLVPLYHPTWMVSSDVGGDVRRGGGHERLVTLNSAVVETLDEWGPGWMRSVGGVVMASDTIETVELVAGLLSDDPDDALYSLDAVLGCVRALQSGTTQ